MTDKEYLLAGSFLADRYQIIKLLGGGNMGNVYLARDKKSPDQPYAIKQMDVPFVNQDQYTKAMADFNREAEILARLNHQAIPKISDYFMEAGCYFLVMEYVAGDDLERLAEQAPGGSLSEYTVTQWSIQLASLLDYIHSQQPPIIYRDLKPSNIIYNEIEDRIVLVDFGIARFIETWQKTVTAIGTMGYAPPELYTGHVLPASDIYSLGATMLHLLTGIPPYQPTENIGQRRPRELNAEITETMEKILLTALAINPADRFHHAAELKQALTDHLLILDRSAIKSDRSDRSDRSIHGLLRVVDQRTNAVMLFHIRKPSFLLGRFDPLQGIIPDINLATIDSSGKISRRHAAIVWQAGDFSLQDLGSSQGCFLNGERLATKASRQLQPGDQIRLAETTLEFSLVE